MPDDTSQNIETARPVVLIIRDGWGRNPNAEHDEFNAVKLASTPVDDRLMREWPNTLIHTSGEDVGLPAGTMGNSEVGHQNIGAGRIVDQEIMRITRAIREGSFFENKALLEAFKHARSNDSAVHLMGLVSNGNVHSSIEHLLALIDLAKKQDWPSDRLFIHCFMDGRDTGPKTGRSFLERVQQKLDETGVGRIASVIGRYYAMDRDNRWDRIALAYRCMTGSEVSHDLLEDTDVWTATDPQQAVQRYYENPTEESRDGDEFVFPTRIVDGEGKSVGLVSDNDAVIFFNFRGDRPRQLTKAFVLSDEQWKDAPRGGFDRGEPLENLHLCTMTNYEQGLPVSAVAFEKPPKMKNILGEIVSSADLKQFRSAETEKFAHVTFFFNDYREQPFEGEHRAMVDSPTDVSTYDQNPEMSAPQVTEVVLDRLEADDTVPLIVLNFANGDMVGHTGKLDAAIKAIEAVDVCVGRIVEATLNKGGSLIVTADHGNAEQMWDPEHDSPHTAHTNYDVPLIIVGAPYKGFELRDDGRLADIAPTILAMMGLEQPEDMTGRSLIVPSEAATAR